MSNVDFARLKRYTDIPAAEATGRLDLRAGCTALRIEHDASGRVTGVLYASPDGKQQFQRAALVAVAGSAIETPRLLLNSASARFPQGLANGAGWVGRCYTKNLNASVWGLFEKPVHMNHGVTMTPTCRRPFLSIQIDIDSPAARLCIRRGRSACRARRSEYRASRPAPAGARWTR